jgi:hypothetical protein
VKEQNKGDVCLIRLDSNFKDHLGKKKFRSTRVPAQKAQAILLPTIQ